MPLAQGQKIIVTSADGTQRRRLPYAQIQGGTARIERYGGFGEFTVNTAIPFSGAALPTILKGDRVEMYYQGILRYRGWIEERLQAEGEPDTLAFTGYGLSFLLGQQLCYGRYAYAGSGIDLADAFAEIVGDATKSRNQTLPPAMGRQGLSLYDATDVQKIGTTTTFVDAYNKLLGDVANDMVAQSGNLCIWGGDVDAYNQNRAYFRPIAPTTTAMHVIPVPARRTQSAQAEDQAGDVKNRCLMTGGQPRFPQLLHNGGFDLPAAFQTGDSGLITDGDFENQSWSLGNGASYKDAGHEEGQPFSGNWMVELDNPGESVDKSGTFATAPTAGHSYVLSVRGKKEVGLQVADGSGYLHLSDASNNLLLSVPITVAPAGTAWDYFSATFPMPAGAAKWNAHFQCDHINSYHGDTGGLLLDAVSLEDASVIYQDGWETYAYGSASYAAVNWAYKDVAFDGLYCVYLSPRAQDVNSQDCQLLPLGKARVSVNFKQTLRISYRYRSPLTAALGLPKMNLQLQWHRSDGSSISTDSVTVNASGQNATWQYVELVASAPSDAVTVLPIVNPRSNGDILIDCISIQDAEAVAAGDVPVAADGHPGYLPEGALSAFLTAGASGLGGAYGASEATYGSRVDITSQGAVNTLPGLTTVAAARLRVKALPLVRPGIVRIEDATVYWPGDSLSLQGKHGPELSGGEILTIAAVELTFGPLFLASLEEGKEAADETLSVKSLVLDQLAKNGPGAAAGAGGTGGYTSATNQGGGATGELGAQATSTSFGTVETDITEANGSVVYTKTTADATFLKEANNLSDLANSGTARANLGLGTAAVANLPAAGSNASAAQVVRGDDTRLTTAAQVATATPSPEAVSSPAAVGTSVSAARADHVHAMPGPFGASGTNHAAGFVPDPGNTAGTTRFLREDGGWQTPAGGGVTIVSQLPAPSAATRGQFYLLSSGSGDTLYYGIQQSSGYALQSVPAGTLVTTPFVPTSIAGCQIWLPADKLSYANGANVTSWPDQSANAYAGTGAGTPIPVFATSADGSLPAVTFGGGKIATTCPSATGAFTVFAVVKPTAAPGGGATVFGTAASGGFDLRIDTGGMEVLAETTSSIRSESYGAVPLNTWVLLMFRVDTSGNWAFYRGNVSSGTTATASGNWGSVTFTASTLVVGNNPTSGSSEQFNGQVGEVIQYNTALSTSDFAKVVSYLKGKWAV